ncbi:MAG: hypothetical protein EWV58_07290 [Microcystis aeruginosa Ma_MB_F_20061100_S19]|nr:MAG: hypothetical protein EWV59_12000 [Microcystis aeruginosa Ma_MB_F_20061100_S19D]TRU16471.1 MAG: hypothetical protein EWV58_07290 [Microcystis aeruginosa Ma_MB_F_20061100_S19]
MILTQLVKFGSLILCVISLTYYRSDQSSCPLCLEWFLPLPRQQDCILEYILPSKPKIESMHKINPTTASSPKTNRNPWLRAPLIPLNQ